MSNKEQIVQQPQAQTAQEKFSDLPTADTERSTFDMSHPWKGTIDAQKIIPCLTMEILPGDTMSIQTTAFMRLATPLKPIMDGLTADLHYFYVPNRIVWDNWQFFMGERKKLTDDPTTVTVPQTSVELSVDLASQTIWDYMGIPLTQPGTPLQKSVNALPARCYYQIWNDWYRNQNLVDEVTVPTDDGPDVWAFPYPSFRHKRGDYFTKSLPYPQKGDPVYLPLGTWAPVAAGSSPGPDFNGKTPTFEDSAANGNPMSVDTSDTNVAWGSTNPALNSNLGWSQPKLHTDLTTATAATINDIRTAFQIQRLLERDARSGTRINEILLAHFNVQAPDFRLQRAEYLGGGHANITINPVASTVATVDAPQGDLSSVGTGLLKAGMTHSFVEHGWLFALISTRASLTYQQGLDRMWSRSTRYDYYWPALSHLGEQQVLNQEVFLKASTGDEDTWGYQERYAEYRYQPGRITGKFRSVDAASLDVWHLSQDFATLPLLNDTFVYSPPPIDRVVAVTDEPDFLVDVWHQINATRVMPVYAVPGMVDHF